MINKKPTNGCKSILKIVKTAAIFTFPRRGVWDNKIPDAKRPQGAAA